MGSCILDPLFVYLYPCTTLYFHNENDTFSWYQSSKKIYDITNINTYIFLVLDLELFNYDARRALLNTHYKAFDHIDDSTPKNLNGKRLTPWFNYGSMVACLRMFSIWCWRMDSQQGRSGCDLRSFSIPKKNLRQWDWMLNYIPSPW